MEEQGTGDSWTAPTLELTVPGHSQGQAAVAAATRQQAEVGLDWKRQPEAAFVHLPCFWLWAVWESRS